MKLVIFVLWHVMFCSNENSTSKAKPKKISSSDRNNIALKKLKEKLKERASKLDSVPEEEPIRDDLPESIEDRYLRQAILRGRAMKQAGWEDSATKMLRKISEQELLEWEEKQLSTKMKKDQSASSSSAVRETEQVPVIEIELDEDVQKFTATFSSENGDVKIYERFAEIGETIECAKTEFEKARKRRGPTAVPFGWDIQDAAIVHDSIEATSVISYDDCISLASYPSDFCSVASEFDDTESGWEYKFQSTLSQLFALMDEKETSLNKSTTMLDELIYSGLESKKVLENLCAAYELSKENDGCSSFRSISHRHLGSARTAVEAKVNEILIQNSMRQLHQRPPRENARKVLLEERIFQQGKMTEVRDALLELWHLGNGVHFDNKEHHKYKKNPHAPSKKDKIYELMIKAGIDPHGTLPGLYIIGKS